MASNPTRAATRLHGAYIQPPALCQLCCGPVRRHRAEGLLDMSDQELADQGVTRDSAVRRAFSDDLDG